MKRSLCVFFSFILVLSCININAIASTIVNDSIVSIPSGVALSDEIIVVLDNNASMQFNDYNTADFSSTGCIQVSELSSYIKSAVKDRVENITNHIAYNQELEEYNGISPDKYNQIISLKFEDSNIKTISSAIKKLRAMPGVLCACPDYYFTDIVPETDADAVVTELSNNTSVANYLSIIEADDAWTIQTGNNTVKVGVVSSGIDFNQSRTSAYLNQTLSRSFVEVNMNESNDYVACHDNSGFGTQAAGLIAKSSTANSMYTGVCNNVELISLKVTEFYYDVGTHRQYRTRLSWVIDAIEYADSLGIKLLNIIPFSYRMINDTDQDLDVVFTQAIEQYNGLVICGAGNTDNDYYNDEAVYPAAVDLPNVLVVGASTNPTVGNNVAEAVCSNSYCSSTVVDIFAPGKALETTHLYNEATFVEGTEFAAALTTGVAALMLSVNPNLSAKEIKHIIMFTGDRKTAFEGNCVSGKRVNAFEAVKGARDHSIIYSNSSANNDHVIFCSDCGYLEHLPHRYYDYDIDGTEFYVVCLDNCGFEQQICGELWGYSNDSQTHTIWCHCMECFSFVDEHTMVCDHSSSSSRLRCSECNYSTDTIGSYVYTQTSSITSHERTCTKCNYSEDDPHIWVAHGDNNNICRICGKTSTIVPMPMQATGETETE